MMSTFLLEDFAAHSWIRGLLVLTRLRKLPIT
jgi:hypothetical protein